MHLHNNNKFNVFSYENKKSLIALITLVLEFNQQYCHSLNIASLFDNNFMQKTESVFNTDIIKKIQPKETKASLVKNHLLFLASPHDLAFNKNIQYNSKVDTKVNTFLNTQLLKKHALFAWSKEVAEISEKKSHTFYIDIFNNNLKIQDKNVKSLCLFAPTKKTPMVEKNENIKICEKYF